MSDTGIKDILVLTDSITPSDELLDHLRQRASGEPVRYHLLAINPVHAEVHLRHPEHHDAADAAQLRLQSALSQISAVVGTQVSGDVSIRNDPHQAVEEELMRHPHDEILIALPPAHHEIAQRLHLDLAHRLQHLHLPVRTLSTPVAAP
jgi:hypothetical protein